MRVVFLIGRDDPNTVAVIARICEIDSVAVAAVLLDTGVAKPKDRWRNLKRNIRREGLTYPFIRLRSALKTRLEDWADGIVPQDEVRQLLDQAFPDLSLSQLAQRRGFDVIRAGNLNGPAAIEALKGVQADLGIVLGTRILKRALFSLPRLGCLNLHKGKVPEYRGMPPGFWELYDGQKSAGITVHFVDDGLDTGDIVGESEVAIQPTETPESLKSKLDQEGIVVLAGAVEQLSRGTATRRPQPPSTQKARTRPTRVQVEALAARTPHWRRLGDGRQILKNAAWLLLFYSGLYSLLRWMRRGQSRGAILLYHRVNDISQDVLTVSTRRFAEHLVALRRYYRPVPTSELVKQVLSGGHIPATSVAIHFDDCYRDVRSCAAPLLRAAGIPGMAFVSSGFIDTDRDFLHDRKKYPHKFPNLRTEDVRGLPALGVDIGAHTVNHVDLGTVALEQARVEVVDSRRQLEALLGRPVLYFSFPFGKITNIREEVRGMVAEAGYDALFAAGGGFIGRETARLDIPRFGVSSDQSPLALLMELEGLSLNHLRYWLGRALGRRKG